MIDLSKHIRPGLNGTLKLVNGTSFSHQGTSVPVYTNTIVDRFFVGDFSAATYNVTVEFSSNKKETMQVTVVARPNEATVSVFGRSTIDDEIITLGGSVNDSYFELIASVTDPSYNGTKLIFFAYYAEASNTLVVPAARTSTNTNPLPLVSSGNVIFQPLKSNTGFKSPNFEVDSSGELTANAISVSGSIDANSITVNGDAVVVDGQTSLPSSFVSSSLTSLGVLTSLDLNGNLTVREGVNTYISVTNGTISIQNQSAGFGTINGVNIGNTRAGSGTFTNLTSTGIVSISGSGSINGIEIGTSNPAAGEFTSVESTSLTAVNGNIDEVVSDNITINNAPTLISHVTRKDYVDTRVTAFSIALGS